MPRRYSEEIKIGGRKATIEFSWRQRWWNVDVPSLGFSVYEELRPLPKSEEEVENHPDMQDAKERAVVRARGYARSILRKKV